MRPVKHVDVTSDITASKLVENLAETGVMGAGALGKSSRIFKKMIDDKDCLVLLGAAGALIPGGMRNILVDMLKRKYIDVFVTTGAMLTHDLIEALGNKHYQGSFYDDDKILFKKNLYRMYDSLMKNNVYQDIEKYIANYKDELAKQNSIKDFIWILGKYINDENSILAICYKHKIPVFCPSLADSGIGLIIWGQQMKGINFNVKAFQDLNEIIDLVWKAKKTGAVYLGGGVPKNYIQQALQFSPKSAASYGIQITMDRPEHGGSSGAKLQEGISWGKLKPNADWVDVTCDVTIALPLIYSYLISKQGK